MNNKDIPADKINESVARARGFAHFNGPWWRDSHGGMLHIEVDSPLTNHNQFHELWTADIEARACFQLKLWMIHAKPYREGVNDFWDDPEYQSSPRLWQLRAYCEAMTNKS